MLLNMKDLLAVANEHKFDVPAFNISDYSLQNGTFEAVQDKTSANGDDKTPDERLRLGEEVINAVT